LEMGSVRSNYMKCDGSAKCAIVRQKASLNVIIVRPQCNACQRSLLHLFPTSTLLGTQIFVKRGKFCVLHGCGATLGSNDDDGQS
jgi:hypothetical protein